MPASGATVHLFAPLYLSNECVSTCTYCGFSAGNEIARRTLTIAEVAAEAAELHRRGFRHMLLVAGEHARIVSRDYLVDASPRWRRRSPRSASRSRYGTPSTYRRLLAAGCDGVTVYQETYDPPSTPAVHLKGKKRNYAWRLAAPDRAAEAGMRRLAIGSLLGLHPRLARRGHRHGRPRPGPHAPVVAVRGVGRPAPAAAGGGRLRAGGPGERPRVRATAVRPAHRAARRRHQPVHPGAGAASGTPWSRLG